MMNEVDHDVLTTIVVTFFINANMVGVEQQESSARSITATSLGDPS